MKRFFSPAKINLFLKILGKRPDGYHELSSLFQTIDLVDYLDCELSEHDCLTCNDAVIPLDTSNLILKATNLFRKKTGQTVGFKIHLDKKIPIQAGLGGGSSNAATTLWACNQLTGGNISVQQLQEWSNEIGSDIPFFFSYGTAHCTGRGEKVLSLEPLPTQNCTIVKPFIGLSTPEVYGQFKLNPDENFHKNFFIEENFCNDLEKPALEIKPELMNLKKELIAAGYKKVLMTGSGSAFYCLGDVQFSKREGLAIYSTKFINRNQNNWYPEVSK